MPRSDRNHIFKTAKKKKRRDSFGPLKRMRKSVPKAEQENIEPDTSDHMRYPLLRAEPEVRISETFLKTLINLTFVIMCVVFRT